MIAAHPCTRLVSAFGATPIVTTVASASLEARRGEELRVPTHGIADKCDRRQMRPRLKAGLNGNDGIWFVQ